MLCDLVFGKSPPVRQLCSFLASWATHIHPQPTTVRTVCQGSFFPSGDDPLFGGVRVVPSTEPTGSDKLNIASMISSQCNAHCCCNWTRYRQLREMYRRISTLQNWKIKFNLDRQSGKQHSGDERWCCCRLRWLSTSCLPKTAFLDDAPFTDFSAGCSGYTHTPGVTGPLLEALSSDYPVNIYCYVYFFPDDVPTICIFQSMLNGKLHVPSKGISGDDSELSLR